MVDEKTAFIYEEKHRKGDISTGLFLRYDSQMVTTVAHVVAEQGIVTFLHARFYVVPEVKTDGHLHWIVDDLKTLLASDGMLIRGGFVGHVEYYDKGSEEPFSLGDFTFERTIHRLAITVEGGMVTSVAGVPTQPPIKELDDLLPMEESEFRECATRITGVTGFSATRRGYSLSNADDAISFLPADG